MTAQTDRQLPKQALIKCAKLEVAWLLEVGSVQALYNATKCGNVWVA